MRPLTRRRAGLVTVAVLLAQVCAVSSAQAAAGDISSAAGSLGSGTATSVAMAARGLAVTGTTMYVADMDANVIRKVDMTTNTASVIGGTGIANNSGDGGPAVAAGFTTPKDVTLDSSGNIYVADTSNHRIRKIDVGTGVITLVAGTSGGYSGDGGQATAAQLQNPVGVAIDSAGAVFIAETGTGNGAGRLRKIATDGTISTLATGLGSPRNIAFDTSGNVYLTDCTADTIIRYPAGGGAGTVVAGTGAGGFTGDGAAATLAKLNCPSGIAIDASNVVYFSDSNNNRIRKYPVGGTITTIAGTGTAGLSGDGAAATAAQLETPTDLELAGGALYVAQRLILGTNSIRTTAAVRKFTVGGNISTVAGNTWSSYSGDGAAATSAQLQAPSGVATDSSNNLYIADTSNNRIRKVTGTTISTVAGTGLPCVTPCGVADIGDGGAATSGNLSGPQGVTVNSSGDIFISDTLHNRIRKVSGGTITTIAGTGVAGFSGDGGLATNAQLSSPYGLFAAADGNIYVADRGNNRIRMISGTTITTIAGTGGAGWSVEGAVATSTMLNGPRDVRVDAYGDIYIADTGNNRIKRVHGTTITSVAGTGYAGTTGDGGLATAARLNAPAGVEVDPAGNLYIADTGNQVIRRVDRHGVIHTIAGRLGQAAYAGDGGAGAASGSSGTSRLASPARIAMDTAGNLYIAGSAEQRVRKLATQTNAATFWTSDATVSHTGATYAWEMATATPTAIGIITFTVPSAINTDATGLYVVGTVNLPTTGTLTLSGGVLTYTLAAAVTIPVNQHGYLAVSGFDNTSVANPYISTVTTETAAAATIDVSQSGAVNFAVSSVASTPPGGSAMLTPPGAKATISTPGTTTIYVDPLYHPDMLVPITATVVDNATLGYELNVQSTAITGPGGTITPASAGIATPVAAGSLAADRIGYTVAGVGGSAAGVAQGTIGSGDYAGYNTVGEYAVIAAKPTSTTGDTVTITNRVKVDQLQAAGVYTGTITWTLTPPRFTPGTTMSLRSASPCCTTRYIMHTGTAVSAAVITSGSTSADKAAASWIVRNGLADSSCVSFESKDTPGSFLRHAGFLFYLNANNGDPVFNEDTTFCPQAVMDGQANSFVAYNYPDRDIRLYSLDNTVHIATNGGGSYNTATSWSNDVSWVVSTPWTP